MTSGSGARPLPRPPAKGPVTLAALGMVVLYIWALRRTDVSPVDLFWGIPDMADLFRRMWPPVWSYIPEMVGPLLETVQIAILGTTLGAVAAAPISVLAARNVSRVRAVYLVARTVLNVIRTLPDLLLAAVFAIAVGIGALPGVMALAVFSFGIIAKLTSETVEAIDPGPLEALQATGANRSLMVHYAVVPQVLPQFVAYCLYVFEINIRVATVLGLVGAGGIGMWLYRDINLLRYKYAAAIILAVFLVVVIIDAVSTRLRERLI